MTTTGARVESFERLGAHLESTYDITITSVETLVRDVYLVRHTVGEWVVRIFPAERSAAEVGRDADLLRFLADHRFPAERVATQDPVTTIGRRSVLITSFIAGPPAGHDAGTAQRMGELLGRLDRLTTEGGAVLRPAGALHHYAPDGSGPAEELRAGSLWLDAIADLVPVGQRAAHERLRQRVLEADDGDGLPQGLIHPDPVLTNAIDRDGDVILIDWAGAGRGPRLASLAVLLWSAAQGPQGWSPERVVAVMDGYRREVLPLDEELHRLAGVMRVRLELFACWRYRHAVMEGRVPAGDEWWWPDDEMIDAVSGCARRACIEAR